MDLVDLHLRRVRAVDRGEADSGSCESGNERSAILQEVRTFNTHKQTQLGRAGLGCAAVLTQARVGRCGVKAARHCTRSHPASHQNT